MFSQRRRKYKTWILAAVATAAVALCLMLLLGYLTRSQQEPYEQTHVNQVVEEAEQTARQSDETASEKQEPVEKIETYYLVKYDKDVIRIFFSDETGKLTKLEDTNIVYEILSTDDQARFESGVRVDTRDDLNKLLMNYES